MDQVMERVEVRGDCWLWTGGKAGAGYGVTYVAQQHRYVHRLSYEHHIGPIPEGLEIDHLCQTPLCVNPEHLEAVTHGENRRRARLTRCKRGHLLSEGRPRLGHGRICRKCDALRAADYRRRRAAA